MMTLRSKVPLDEALMTVCTLWANARSKDPNTQVGACVFDKHGGMHLGYNGFPTGIADDPVRWQRPTKYEYVIHAEVNAIIKALRNGVAMEEALLFVTHKPCHRCMGLIIQSGIKHVYYLHPHDNSPITDELALEANIICTRLITTE